MCAYLFILSLYSISNFMKSDIIELFVATVHIYITSPKLAAIHDGGLTCAILNRDLKD